SYLFYEPADASDLIRKTSSSFVLAAWPAQLHAIGKLNGVIITDGISDRTVTMAANYDVAIIGGGILGLATAMRLNQQFPRYRIGVIEKEHEVAAHQSGHNSGVIHQGIYYAPGSLKAKNCVAGARAMMEFCDANGIKYDLCGKVIVATSEAEVPRLDELM